MRYLQIILMTLISFSTQATTANQMDNDQISIAMTNFESQIESCRNQLQNLVQDNPRVMNQFDLFSRTLTTGEGFVDKDMYRIIDAVGFAAEKHRLQVRKDPNQTPYIIHPIGVADSLMNLGQVRDTEIIIAALLHDTVEDTDATFEEIEQRFGIRVANFVREVTDDKSLPKQIRKQLQIEHASHKSAGAAQIKLADKLYNLTDLLKMPPTDWEIERIDTYFKWAQSVVDQLPLVNPPLKEAIDKVIQAYWQNK